ncbi:MAG: zinc ribbon domain-containing protein [Deltaproteobacteria bacterium]|nr:zinc ribbon domain-containing protein [Deltaproteobacteria bacterium]
MVFGDNTPACPKCGNAKTKKLMSRPCRQNSSTDSGPSDDHACDCGSASGCGSCSGGHCASCH